MVLQTRLLLMSQYVQMAAAFTLAALVYVNRVQIWHVLTLSVITGSLAAMRERPDDPVKTWYVSGASVHGALAAAAA